MNQVARPYLAAGAAFATAAGLVAVAPVLSAPALPDFQVSAVQVPAVELTGFAEDLQGALQGFNDFVLGNLVHLNSGLVDGQVGFEQFIFGSDSALNGVINRLFNVFNMGLGGGQNFLNGLIGIRPDQVTDADPANLTWNLLVGQNPFGIDAPNVFNSGEIGGLEGMFVQGLQAFANVTGIPGDAAAAGLNSALIDINSFLVSGVLNFNSFLTDVELGFEQLISPLFLWLPHGGADSLFNGALNRAFDTFNMMVDAGEQSFLGLLGANFDPVDVTSSLLTTVGHPLSDGTIGGIEGVLSQAYMAIADFFGMFGLL